MLLFVTNCGIFFINIYICFIAKVWAYFLSIKILQLGTEDAPLRKNG
nr:MAG TPA: hypothetical protein [Caudoviricetes sp.]